MWILTPLLISLLSNLKALCLNFLFVKWGYQKYLPHEVIMRINEYIYVYIGVYIYVCVCTRSVMSNSLWPFDCSPPGSSVHGILQARILEWLAFPPSGDLPDPGIEPASPKYFTLAGRFFTIEPPRKLVHSHTYTHTYTYIYTHTYIFIIYRALVVTGIWK